MKYNLLLLIIFSTVITVSGQKPHYSKKPVIAVTQVGYIRDADKKAWLVGSGINAGEWVIAEAGGNNKVYSGAINNKFYDEAFDDSVSCIDFSGFAKAGEFYIEINGVPKSYVFTVSDNPYNELFKASVKSFYYQRSGMELTKEYAGIWAKPASHTKDGYLYAGFKDGEVKKGKFKKSNGGWYDAGDFGKKVAPAAIALYPFMKLAQMKPGVVGKIDINIPNPYAGLPDMLAEAKWELDWFFTMQNKEGGVHHLITTPEFWFLGEAHQDPQTRYIVSVATTSTADFAAIMALASKVYRPYMPKYAEKCLKAALKAWKFLEQNPGIFPEGGYNDPPGINQTGKYEDGDDSDERLWAAAELYAVTNDEKFRDFFEENYRKEIDRPTLWWYPLNYAYYTWLESFPGEKGKVLNEIRQTITNWADNVIKVTERNGFELSIQEHEYYFGSNSNVLNTGMEMIIIDNLLGGNKYSHIALSQLNYVLGCNSLNFSFVSGYGTAFVKDPHQSINTYDMLSEAPPGFLCGGPNRYIDGDEFLGPFVEITEVPPAKCYIDSKWSYAGNEVCVTYNSGLVFLAGYFTQTE